MAVTRRPKKETQKKQASVEDLIMRGESSTTTRVVKNEKESKEDEIKRVQMRIPLSKLDEIDNSTKSRPGKLSRHTWIMEAIEEKLKRENEE